MTDSPTPLGSDLVGRLRELACDDDVRRDVAGSLMDADIPCYPKYLDDAFIAFVEHPAIVSALQSLTEKVEGKGFRQTNGEKQCTDPQEVQPPRGVSGAGWREAAEPFFRLAREVINPVDGERPWHADSADWMVVFSFAGQSVTLGDLRRAASIHGDCVKCGGALEAGPWGFTDCPACNPNPARG